MGAAHKLETTVEPSPQQNPSISYLLGRRADLWLVGGASLFAFFGFQMFTAQDADLYRISMWMYYLSMLVNWPHFMVSYQLLYWDRRKDLLKKPSYIWAGVIAPFLLFAVIGAGFLRTDRLVFTLLTQFMFLTVGWHYVKQVFGTMVVSSAVEKFYFSKIERLSLLTNLFSLWALSFLAGQSSGGESEFFGLKYALLGVNPGVLQASYVFVGISAAVTLWLFTHRFLREGRLPSRTALVSFAALYAWYLPFLGHRHFFYMIPFFHSVQYFLFVLSLKKNRWSAEQRPFAAAEGRRQTLVKASRYFGVAFVLGLIFFSALPNFLDAYVVKSFPWASEVWSPAICMAVVQLFINVHHYFIDNVIWKSDNPEVREHLIRRPSA